MALGHFLNSDGYLNCPKSNASGGGGGSSDFSTATVTFVVSSTDPDGGGGWSNITTINGDYLEWLSEFSNFAGGTAEVLLYKGHAYGYASAMDMSVSGDVIWDSEEHTIDIYGDCTITYVEVTIN